MIRKELLCWSIFDEIDLGIKLEEPVEFKAVTKLVNSTGVIKTITTLEVVKKEGK